MEKRMQQLKFIASMFRLTMNEFNTTMGPETIQTIFRLIGERQGKEVIERWNKKYGEKKWSIDDVATVLISDVLEPVLGESQVDIKKDNESTTIILKVCPFKKAGIKIEEKFYCTYTEGLLDTIFSGLLGDITFKTKQLRSIDKCDCEFEIHIK